MPLAVIATALLLAWSTDQRFAAQEAAIEHALQAGAYAEAEALARGWSVEVERLYEGDSQKLTRALDLFVAAAIGNGKAADSATLALAKRVLALKEQSLGPHAAALATALHNLGSILESRGEFRSALALHERGLAIRRATAPPDGPEIADSLDATGRAFLGLERRSDAEKAIEHSLVIRVAQSDESPLALARTLELSGRAKRDAGRYQAAAADLDQALDLWSRFAPGHPDTSGALDTRGYVYFLQGDIPGSRRVWGEGVALTDGRLDAWHPNRARSARSLALAEFALGELAAARALRERAVTIGERAMAPCDPEVAFQLNDLAISLQYDGDYSAADRMFRRELATIRSCLGPNHSNAATAVFNQFVLAREVGSYTEANRLGHLAVQLWTNSLGPSHPFVAFGLNDLADFLAFRNDRVQAQRLFERVLRIRRRELGSDHPDVAWTLTGLARTKADLSDVVAARTLLQQALAIFERTPPRDPDYISTALALRGALEAREGDYRAARGSLEEALARREKNLGPNHPLVASTRADLAAVDLALGSHNQAFLGALVGEASARNLLRFTVRYMPERRALEYAGARPRGLDIALTVVADDIQTAAPTALDAVIQSRGIVLDELAARARAVPVADPQTASIAQSLADARRRFAGMVLRSLGGQSSEPDVLERTWRAKEDIEEALAARSAALRTELSQVDVGLADVRRAMPAKSALVSFVRYDRIKYVNGVKTIRRQTIPSYIAFVSRSDRQNVDSVVLGAAASLEELIARWREHAAGRAITGSVDAALAEQAYREIGTRLRQRIWDPIAAYTAGVDRMFIVPDGALNLVSFAALPVSHRRYLIEDVPPIHYLSTERDLIRQAGPGANHGLLLVGGPSYNASSSAPRAGERRSACLPEGTFRFDDLPGSRAEVKDLAALWSAAEPAGSVADDVIVLSGRAAKKSAVVSQAPGRRILHFATHGFFLGGCTTPTVGTRSIGGLVGPSRAITRDANPLLLAGLAFAGANAPTGQWGTTILTAEEVSALNLQGTEWAVLSACDTGVGQITAGEGVLGLRRAFQVAGVKTIIMSLWSVQDQATRDWMVALYRARLFDHLDTATAVQQAGLTLLQKRRAKGRSTHPFYWAAFVAAGDWI
jgi:CHAT domain-containing protein/tetratricopeptide (TPR) repeat protein